MEPRVFRILFWQKLMPLLALPVFAGMFALSPAGRGWSGMQWGLAGAAAALAIAAYGWSLWRRSAVRLDADGVTLHLRGGMATWPLAKLLKVKQIGHYRVKMCFDPDVPDKHYHITIDLLDADGFVDALLDWYEATQGRELAFAA